MSTTGPGSVTPRVLLVDDHTVLSQALADALALHGITEVQVAGPHELGAEAVVARAAAWQPSVVLLDLYLGDGMPATPLIQPLRATGATVVVLTASEDRAVWGQALEAGAAGVLPKSVDFNELVAAIRRAGAGVPVLNDRERAGLLDELHRSRQDVAQRLAAFQRLTPREQEVLAALIEGRAAKQIARELHMSMPTIRTHIRSVLEKLGVNSQREAVAAALGAGWKPDSR